MVKGSDKHITKNIPEVTLELLQYESRDGKMSLVDIKPIVLRVGQGAPKTGDSQMPFAWAGMLFAAGGAMRCTRRKTKRK